MAGSRYRLSRDVRVEDVGDETIVFDRSSGESIHKVTGAAFDALRLIAEGIDDAEMPAHLRPAVEELAAAGIVEDSPQWSRRSALVTGGKGLLAGGAVWGAATVTTFALADPAAAATPCTSPGPTTPAAQKYTASATYITGRGVTSLQVRVWGAGGGGGGGRYTGVWASGAGGGGGAYAYTASLAVVPCTAYSVVVGSGGSGGGTGGGASGKGGDGGDSYFGTNSTVMAKGGVGGSGGTNGTNYSGGTGGQAASSVGTAKTSGGNGGQSGKNSGENTGGGGGGGASDGGNGGNGGDHNGTAGTGGAAGGAVVGGAGGIDSGAGNAPSGGGGGGHGDLFGSSSGGAGARGQVWIGF